MYCKKCKTELIIRSGKFGNFYCCPKSTKQDNHGTQKVTTSRPASVGGIREIAFNDSPIQGIGNIHYSRDHDYEDDWGMGHLVGLDGWGGD